MEAVAWLAGEPHSDHPICTCPVLAAYVRALNDRMPDAVRQRLKDYLPILIGTRNEALELKRAQYLAWDAITVMVPIALDAVGLTEHAETLKNLVPNDWVAACAAVHAAADAAEAAGASAAARAADAAEAVACNAAYTSGAAEADYASRAAAAAYHAAEAVTNPNDVWELTLLALNGAIEIT